MARITVEDCLQQIPNRFQLVLAATYRARLRHLHAKPLQWGFFASAPGPVPNR